VNVRRKAGFRKTGSARSRAAGEAAARALRILEKPPADREEDSHPSNDIRRQEPIPQPSGSRLIRRPNRRHQPPVSRSPLPHDKSLKCPRIAMLRARCVLSQWCLSQRAAAFDLRAPMRPTRRSGDPHCLTATGPTPVNRGSGAHHWQFGGRTNRSPSFSFQSIHASTRGKLFVIPWTVL